MCHIFLKFLVKIDISLCVSEILFTSFEGVQVMNIFNLQYTIAITVEDVWNQLCRLKPCKSSGPDNCHPRVLLELKEGLVKPLSVYDF